MRRWFRSERALAVVVTAFVVIVVVATIVFGWSLLHTSQKADESQFQTFECLEVAHGPPMTFKCAPKH